VQVGEDAHVMLNGFGTVVNSLGKRAKPYLPQVRRVFGFSHGFSMCGMGMVVNLLGKLARLYL